MLLPVSLILVGSTSQRSAEQRQPKRLLHLLAVGCWCYLAAAALVATVVPFGILRFDLIEGPRALLANPANLHILRREIFLGAMFAALACAIAVVVLRLVIDGSRGAATHSRRGLVAMILAPGLAGSLVVGLVLLALFQQPAFNRVYGTAIPWVLALVILSLPRLALLQILLFARREQGALHASALLANSPQMAQRGAARELTWHLRTKGLYWTTALAAFWAYFDVSATTLLAPTRLTPAVVRLYNLMHYGRNASLSTLTAMAVLAPVILCVLVAFLWRRAGRWLPV
jgi:ABC-type Fe3+ transport system permease subunit